MPCHKNERSTFYPSFLLLYRTAFLSLFSTIPLALRVFLLYGSYHKKNRPAFHNGTQVWSFQTGPERFQTKRTCLLAVPHSASRVLTTPLCCVGHYSTIVFPLSRGFLMPLRNICSAGHRRLSPQPGPRRIRWQPLPPAWPSVSSPAACPGPSRAAAPHWQSRPGNTRRRTSCP